MTINRSESTSIITPTNENFELLIDAIKNKYDTIKDGHIIMSIATIGRDLGDLIDLSNLHRESGKSFVITCEEVDLEQMPEELIIVPTMQEAHDMIEMETIERDLGFL